MRAGEFGRYWFVGVPVLGDFAVLQAEDVDVLGKVFPPDRVNSLAAVVIRLSALPAGAAVYISDSSNSYGYLGIHIGLAAGQQAVHQ